MLAQPLKLLEWNIAFRIAFAKCFFRFHPLNGHDPLPGQGQQILHSDAGKVVGPPMQHQIVNSMWMLSNFTPNNGATRVVPSSHLELRAVNEQVEDPLASHPEQFPPV